MGELLSLFIAALYIKHGYVVVFWSLVCADLESKQTQTAACTVRARLSGPYVNWPFVVDKCSCRTPHIVHRSHKHPINKIPTYFPISRCAAHSTQMHWTTRGSQPPRFSSSTVCRKLEVKHSWNCCDACRRKTISTLKRTPCNVWKWFDWIIGSNLSWPALLHNYRRRLSTPNTFASPISPSNYTRFIYLYSYQSFGVRGATHPQYD